MNIYYAKTIAENYLRELQPYCEPGMCCIAGSIRRKKEEVGDIEIVCRPDSSLLEVKDLFGEVTSKTLVIHPAFEAAVKSFGEVLKGKVTGRQMVIKTVHGIHGKEYEINVDLFMPVKEDYWRQFAIRTGSADFAHQYLANKWVAKGWCGVKGIGLRLQRECYQVMGNNNKPMWLLKNDIQNPTLPPEWKSEEEFFRWLGLNWYQWQQPEHRNL